MRDDQARPVPGMPGDAVGSWFLKPDLDGGAVDITGVIKLMAVVGMRLSLASEHAVVDADGDKIHVRWCSPWTWELVVQETTKLAGPAGKMLFVMEHPVEEAVEAIRANPRAMLCSVPLGRVWWDGAEAPRYGRRKPSTVGTESLRETAGMARALLLTPGAPSLAELERAVHLSPGGREVAFPFLENLIHVDERADRRVHVRNRQGLLHAALEVFPGAVGTTSRWTHPAPLHEQASLVAEIEYTVISGDLAALHYTGLGTQEHVIAYCFPGWRTKPSDLNLWQLGFTPATVEDYTLEFTIPGDETIRLTRPRTGPSAGFADEIVTAFDIERTTTTGTEFDISNVLREQVIAGEWGDHHDGRAWF
jgi:hypothetical protein